MRDIDTLLEKSVECLDGAKSEAAYERYNNSANRSYYACFQAAIAALISEGIRPPTKSDWSHKFVQSHFVGDLINRRKRYSSELRDTLASTLQIRLIGDYEMDEVSEIQAHRALRKATRFVNSILSSRTQ